MAGLAHHASSAQILALASEQRQRLNAQALHERPFVLCVMNTVWHAATLRAAADISARVVLAPGGSPAVLALAASNGVRTVVEVGASGELSVVAREDGCKQPKSADSFTEGYCAVATSGSGQDGSKLVIHAWAACELQAKVTAERTLREAAPKRGTVRVVAASSIGHAYNLNGFFAAMAAGAELCLPASPAQLAATLAAEPAGCEATVVFATPQMYAGLLALEEASTLGAALRTHGKPVYAFSAGCPLPRATLLQAARLLGLRILQNFGTSETGVISVQVIVPAEHGAVGVGFELELEETRDPSAEKGLPWGKLELREAHGGRLLPPLAEGEIATLVPWGSQGYLVDGQLQPHSDAPYVRTGDAARMVNGELLVMQRLRKPLEVWRDGLRLLLQAYEVEEALLRGNPKATAAAALQGPEGTLLCALACPADVEVAEGWLRPDKLLRLERMPTSPAGKVLYSVLYEQLVAL